VALRYINSALANGAVNMNTGLAIKPVMPLPLTFQYLAIIPMSMMGMV
jgi:hypothetical protein